MAKKGGYLLSDLSIEDKFEYRKQLNSYKTQKVSD
jgi:hypothetical protein